MKLGKISAIVVAVVLCLSIVWFYPSPKSEAVATLTDSGVQRIEVTADSEYTPNEITAEAGVPLEVVFLLKSEGCADTVVFDKLGITQPLKLNEKTVVNLGVLKPGIYEFHCGMNMLSGKLVVR